MKPKHSCQQSASIITYNQNDNIIGDITNTYQPDSESCDKPTSVFIQDNLTLETSTGQIFQQNN